MPLSISLLTTENGLGLHSIGELISDSLEVIMEQQFSSSLVSSSMIGVGSVDDLGCTHFPMGELLRTALIKTVSVGNHCQQVKQ